MNEIQQAIRPTTRSFSNLPAARRSRSANWRRVGFRSVHIREDGCGPE